MAPQGRSAGARTLTAPVCPQSHASRRASFWATASRSASRFDKGRTEGAATTGSSRRVRIFCMSTHARPVSAKGFVGPATPCYYYHRGEGVG